MTCIAALKHGNEVFMAGERAVSNDEVIHLLSTPKIWKYGEYLIGYAGHMSGLTVYNSFLPPQPGGLRGKRLDYFMNTEFLQYTISFYEEHGIKTDGLDLLIAVGDRIYEHSTDNMSLYSYAERYQSIGSGSSYVMGSLFSTAESSLSGAERLRLALKSAVTFSPSCGGRIDLISMQVKK